jgi:hypothetical protein
MNRSMVFLGCLLFAVGGQVWAGCSPPASNQVKPASDIESLLTNDTICGTGLGDNAGDQWQEWHQSDGTLTEYAKGPDDPVDPTHDVGNWSVSGQGANSIVTYDYGNGGSYSFEVWNNNDGSYSFCSGGNEVATATLISGQDSCGF